LAVRSSSTKARPSASADHDAAGVAARRGRRVDGHDHALEGGRRRAPAAGQVLGPEQAALALDDQAVQLLGGQAGAAVQAVQRRQEGRRQVVGVGAGRGAGVHRARLGDQVAQGADRPGRGGDHQARINPQAQAEAQHGQGLGGLGPGAELVGPGGVELRPAQAVGILGREGLGDGAVVEFQAPAAGVPLRAFAGGIEALDARRALDHHLAHVVEGGADQGQAADLRGLFGDPRGPGEGLARAATAQEQPGGPGISGGLLVRLPALRHIARQSARLQRQGVMPSSSEFRFSGFLEKRQSSRRTSARSLATRSGVDQSRHPFIDVSSASRSFSGGQGHFQRQAAEASPPATASASAHRQARSGVLAKPGVGDLEALLGLALGGDRRPIRLDLVGHAAR
jgi:hypothetical protein